MKWVADGYRGEMPLPEESSFEAIRAKPNGVVSLLCRSAGWESYPTAPYYAIGAGADVAWGALFVGASAEDAVRAAIEHSQHAKGDVVSIRHSL